MARLLFFFKCVLTLCRIDFRMQSNLTITCPNSICFSIMKSENFQLSSQKSFSREVCVANGQKKGKSIYSLLSAYALLSHPFLHIYQYTIFGEISKGCFLKQLWTIVMWNIEKFILQSIKKVSRNIREDLIWFAEQMWFWSFPCSYEIDWIMAGYIQLVNTYVHYTR